MTREASHPELPEDETRPSRRKFIGGLAAGAAAGVVGGALGATGEVSAAAAQQLPPDDLGPGSGQGFLDDFVPRSPAEARRIRAYRIREHAASLAAEEPLPNHVVNGDERPDLDYALSFTKGLPHDHNTGLLSDPADYEQFVYATKTGKAQDFLATPLGPRTGFRTVDGEYELRAWESQGIGHAFDLVGPDPQSVTMPPPPAVGSPELTAEMAEVYAQAILRDEPLSALRLGTPANTLRDETIASLNEFDWFFGWRIPGLTNEQVVRRRESLVKQTAFRGLAPGDTTGPYLSQLLLVGSANDEGQSVADGLIEYGAQTIDQRVRRAEPANFMNTWDDWFDIQCALEPPIRERYQGRRFITTGRDLATYVHSDALYQPYLNASLVLFSQGIGLDTDMPFGQKDADDHQQGFVLFGPNHVLSLLAEVCTRGFKAVKYQKFNVHRRQRPEQLGARIERAGQLRIPELDTVAEAIEASPIAERIRSMNQAQTGQASLLLPMAYPEGAPMHPSYGAGHGTIAGACTTVLKALFDHTQPFQAAGSADQAFVPTADGNALETVRVLDESGRQVGLTVEGELNKLAANIAIARNWAGVHYFSDYWESVLFGEQIALAILREQMLAIPNDFTLTVPLFDGTTATVSR